MSNVTRKFGFNELVLRKQREPLNETTLCLKEIVNVFVTFFHITIELTKQCVCDWIHWTTRVFAFLLWLLSSSRSKSYPTYSPKNKCTHKRGVRSNPTEGVPGGAVPANAGTWVRDLVREDPTCRGATKPMRHNHWAHALEPASHNYWSPRS